MKEIIRGWDEIPDELITKLSCSQAGILEPGENNAAYIFELLEPVQNYDVQVDNLKQKSFEFVPLDNGLFSKEVSKCDWLLYTDEIIVFCEIKYEKAGAISNAIKQLRETLKLFPFLIVRNSGEKRKIYALVCNKPVCKDGQIRKYQMQSIVSFQASFKTQVLKFRENYRAELQLGNHIVID